MQEAVELRECCERLNEVLQTLDRMGAGIAAIHVDAAIEQLCTNLELIEEARIPEGKLIPLGALGVHTGRH